MWAEASVGLRMGWPMQPEDEPAVRAIHAECHPEMPPRAARWYWAYPTLVLVQDNAVVGFTSFSLSPGPTGALTLFGNDVCVRPSDQRRGFGWALAQDRLEIGRELGATAFVGLTAVTNQSMQRIFERQGLHACQRLPAYFGAVDGVVWVGAL